MFLNLKRNRVKIGLASAKDSRPIIIPVVLKVSLYSFFKVCTNVSGTPIRLISDLFNE